MSPRTTYQVSSPAFIADPHSIDRLGGGRQIDWSFVGEERRTTPGTPAVVVVVGAAGAAGGAVSVPVAALSAAIPSGTTLDFGGAKFARLTAPAAAGAVALTVTALVTALVNGDTATYAGTKGSGTKMLKAGTVLGDTLGGTGKMSPRVVTTNPAKGILETNAFEESETNASTGYGIIAGGVLFETLLPDAVAGVLAAGIKTELAANTKGFLFLPYSDSRAT